jgi:AhpD family alkylhydroperoxidase
MESKIKSLIPVGASVAANCQPCLRSAIDGAHESGVEEKEIAEAIEIARSVKKGAMATMDKFTLALIGNAEAVSDDSEEGCGCS